MGFLASGSADEAGFVFLAVGDLLRFRLCLGGKYPVVLVGTEVDQVQSVVEQVSLYDSVDFAVH